MTNRPAMKRGDSPTMAVYLAEIQGEPLLSADEERSLSAGIAAGDSDARSRMIRANLLLVVSVALRYGGRGLAMDDLIAEGNLGLIRATKDFKTEFGTRFSTYAVYWIKQAIRDALNNTTATIRIPCHMTSCLTKWKRSVAAFTQESGHAPTHDETADSLGLSGNQRRAVGHARRSKSLTAGGSDADSGFGAADEPAYRGEAADGPINAEDARLTLGRLMGCLDAREAKILGLRFGLGGGERLTLKEAGTRLGITREWVRKIEKSAICKLADSWML